MSAADRRGSCAQCGIPTACTALADSRAPPVCRGRRPRSSEDELETWSGTLQLQRGRVGRSQLQACAPSVKASVIQVYRVRGGAWRGASSCSVVGERLLRVCYLAVAYVACWCAILLWSYIASMNGEPARPSRRNQGSCRATTAAAALAEDEELE